jgi:PAS domain-containing protein
MSSRHAPAERSSSAHVENQYSEILNVEFINLIFDSLPYIAAVLNDQRQVIFSNQTLLKSLGVNSIQDVLGARPGEMLNCVNSQKEVG